MLKLLACLFMLLDHIGYYCQPWLPGELVAGLRTVGRLAFPIFAWGIALGYNRTRNPLLYFARMTGFALASEIIIRASHQYADLHWPGSNVLVTFALAIVIITGYRLAIHSYLDMVASLRPVLPGASPHFPDPRYDVRINVGGIELNPRLGLLLGLLVMALAVLSTLWLRPDYGVYGLMTVLIFYMVRDLVPKEDVTRRSLQFFILLNAVFLIYQVMFDRVPFEWALIQTFSIAAVPICDKFKREKKPGRWLKYSFYLFYPLHIVALVGLHAWLAAS